MRDFAIVFVHLIVTLARLARPGGLRSFVAESVIIRHQLVINRGRKRAPNLRATDRIIAGLCTLFLRPARVFRFRHRDTPPNLMLTSAWVAPFAFRGLLRREAVQESSTPSGDQILLAATLGGMY